MKNTYYSLIVLAVLLASDLQAQCSLYPVALSDRANNSSLIVQGRVLSRTSYWNAARNYIYTSNLIQVNQVLKGGLFSDYVEVITEGGEVGLSKQTVEPSLQLNINDEGIFFLQTSKLLSQYRFPVHQTYADQQGFIKFDLREGTATEPFRKYNSIAVELYPELGDHLGTVLTPLPLSNSGKYSSSTIASISGISPLIITAGTFSILTISGSGFGATQGTNTVEFRNADDGGSTFIFPHASQYVSWSNTQIQVIVPTRASTVTGTAGNGQVRVTVAGSSTLSAQTLTVNYGEINLFYSANSTIYQTRHVELNGSSGISWQMFTGFDANTLAKTAFFNSLQTWRCATYINWQIGPTTTTNVIALDGVNIVRFDITTELPIGVLGRCTSYFGGCVSGPNVFWYISELDICFDDGANWQLGPGLATGLQYDFESVSLHELGHGHQLSHVINSADVMHYSLSNAQNKRSLITNNINGGNDVMLRNVSPGICSRNAMVALSSTNCALIAPTGSFNVTSPVCVGQSVALNALSPFTLTAWSWTITGGSPSSSTLQNTSTNYASPGIYTISLMVTNTFSNSSVFSRTISVLAQPTVSIPSATICSGSSTLLTAGGATNYTWLPGSLTGSAQTLNPLSSTNYTIIGSNGTCSSSATATIAVNTTPTVSVGSATICRGNSTTLTAGGAANYTWNPGALTGSLQALSPTVTTAYTVTGRTASCNSSPVTATITVLITPTLSVASASVCSGNSATLTGSGSATYSWLPGALTGSSQVFSPAGTTVYTISGGPGTCTSLTTSTLSVLPSPTLSLVNATICTGSSTVLAASGATTYVWNPGNLSGASQTLSPAATTNYTVTGTIGSCTSTVTRTLTVVTTPTVIVPPAFICSGTSTLLTATGASVFVWNPGNLVGAAQTIGPGSTTIYTITGSNGSCTHVANTTVSVTTTPTVLVANAAICSGNSTVLIASGAGSYTWNPGNLTGASQNLNPLSTTVYTVRGSIGSCTSAANPTINVTITPTVTVPSVSICSGNSVSINASGASSYFWQPGFLTGATQVVIPSSTINYTIFGNNGTCSHVTTATLSVSPTPVISVPNAFICSGNSTIVTASGAVNYVWSPGALSGATQTLNPANTLVYSIVGSIGSCSASAFSSVIVNLTPTVMVSNAAICSGNTAVLTASGAASYVWSPGALTGVTQTLNPMTTTIYTVVGSSSSCTASVTGTVSVTNTPSVSAISSVVICSGTSYTSQVQGANSFIWSPGSLSGSVQVLSPLSTTVYTITGSIGTCTGVTTSTINVITTPTVTSGSASVCSGNSVVLSAGGASTYVWIPGGLSGSTQTLTPLSTTVYTITGSISNCTSSTTGTVTVVATPTLVVLVNPSVMCIGETATLIPEGAATYSYMPGNISGTSAVVSPVTTTNYTVTAQNASCLGSKEVILTVSSCNVIPENVRSTGYAVFPNPNKGLFTLSFSEPFSGNVQAFTTLGQSLFLKEVNGDSDLQLDLRNYAEGVYLIQITSQEGQKSIFKVLKE